MHGWYGTRVTELQSRITTGLMLNYDSNMWWQFHATDECGYAFLCPASLKNTYLGNKTQVAPFTNMV